MVMFKRMINTTQIYIDSTDIAFYNLCVNVLIKIYKRIILCSFIVVSKKVFARFWITETRKSVGEYLYASPFFFICSSRRKYPKNISMANLSKHKIKELTKQILSILGISFFHHLIVFFLKV